MDSFCCSFPCLLVRSFSLNFSSFYLGGNSLMVINFFLRISLVPYPGFNTEVIHVLQKLVHRAGLRLLCLKRPACKLGPWLVSGNLTGKLISSLIRKLSLYDKGSSLCLNCTNKCFMLNICFLSWSLEFCNVLGRGCLCDQTPIKPWMLSL